MKPLTIACFALFLLGVAAFVAQMWFHIWEPEIFLKIIITNGCVFAVVFVMQFLIKEEKIAKSLGRNELK
jgi:hypothetical protein